VHRSPDGERAVDGVLAAVLEDADLHEVVDFGIGQVLDQDARIDPLEDLPDIAFYLARPPKVRPCSVQ
jgi:hypothetical protein